MKTKFQSRLTPALSELSAAAATKFTHIALLVFLGASLAAPVSAQPGSGQGVGPGSGMGPGQGMGPGAGMGPGGGRAMRFSFNKDNTPGWALMSAEERTAHRSSMIAAKSYEECKAAQQEQHKAMEARAKEKGVTLPKPRYNGCDRMKARGFFK
ncbi:MAG: hypothetical protein Q8O52_07620 [Sulfuritalea sp.]|nr:hypothetical protein [Sulfuritalea sp.]